MLQMRGGLLFFYPELWDIIILTTNAILRMEYGLQNPINMLK